MKNKCCDFYQETRGERISGIKTIISYTNPFAYDYPEIVHWNKEYKVNFCPMCGRKINFEVDKKWKIKNFLNGA